MDGRTVVPCILPLHHREKVQAAHAVDCLKTYDSPVSERTHPYSKRRRDFQSPGRMVEIETKKDPVDQGENMSTEILGKNFENSQLGSLMLTRSISQYPIDSIMIIV